MDNGTCFDKFGVQHIPKDIKILIGNKNISISIYRMQENVSIICEYFWIGFIDFMLKGKCMLDYTKLLSPNKFQKYDKIILKYF